MKLREFIGNAISKKTDYHKTLDVLQSMDIRANLSSIDEKYADRWRTLDEAAEDQKWMFFDATPDQVGKTRLYLERNLVRKDGMFQLP